MIYLAYYDRLLQLRVSWYTLDLIFINILDAILLIRCPILDNVYNLARRTSVLEDAFQIY